MMTQKADNPKVEFPVCEGDWVKLEADAVELSQGRAVVLVTISKPDGTETRATLAMVPARA
jgi:hypothetical protein